jgi:regulator of protease activity HflC (stomatin/prohibitin superfamily)
MVATIVLSVLGGVLIVLLIVLLLTSLKVVRPIERGLIERFGKYQRYAQPGLAVLMPFGIEKLIRVNTTEQMVSSEKREIITADSLNAIVDSNVYFKVKDNEQDVKASIYNVNNYAATDCGAG